MRTDSLNDITYQASSPGKINLKKRKKISICHVLDEYALVTALKEMGVVFFRRTPDSVVINFVNKFNFVAFFLH